MLIYWILLFRLIAVVKDKSTLISLERAVKNININI